MADNAPNVFEPAANSGDLQHRTDSYNLLISAFRYPQGMRQSWLNQVCFVAGSACWMPTVASVRQHSLWVLNQAPFRSSWESFCLHYIHDDQDPRFALIMRWKFVLHQPSIRSLLRP